MNELAISIIDQHIPSLTKEAEEEIDQIITNAGADWDFADCGLRYCSCGERIEGYYEYVWHLKEVLK